MDELLSELKYGVKEKLDDLAHISELNIELEEHNKELSEENKKLYYDKLKLIKRVEDLEKIILVHNTRGAGRKNKFTNDQIQAIMKSREDGNSMRKIAIKFDCSVGLVHKIINAQK